MLLARINDTLRGLKNCGYDLAYLVRALVGRIISSVGDGGDAKLPDGKAGKFQAKKHRYGLDMEGFWLCDNCRIIAVIAHPKTSFVFTAGAGIERA